MTSQIYLWNYIPWSNYVLSFKGHVNLQLCILLWTNLRKKKRKKKKKKKN